MRESVAVVCHGQGAIAVSDKSRTPRPQEISSLKQLFSYPEWLLMRGIHFAVQHVQPIQLIVQPLERFGSGHVRVGVIERETEE